jgi:hypothetical protein
MRLHVTDHAARRYVLRAAPDLTVEEARDEIEARFPAARELLLPAQNGSARWRLGGDRPCVLFCRTDGDIRTVMTVLGPSETLLAAEQKVFDTWERRFLARAVAAAIENVPSPDASDEFTRFVRDAIVPAIDAMIADFYKNRAETTS